MFPLVNEKSLDPKEYANARYTHTKSVLPMACRQVILDYLTSSRMIFSTDGETPIKLKTEFQRYLEQHIKPFIEDCVDEICVLGIVAFDYKVIQDELDKRPIVVPYVMKETLGKSYDITIMPDSPQVGCNTYRFYKLVDPDTGFSAYRELDNNVRIITGFGYDPTTTGELRSIASSIIWQEIWLSRMYTYSVRLEQIRADGAIFLESTVDTQQGIKTLDRYMDADQSKKSTETTYKMNKEEIKDIEEARHEVYQEYLKDVRQQYMSSGGGPLSSDEIGYESVGAPTETPWIPIPPGRKVARVQQPSGLHDWATVNQNYQNNICASYNVPRRMIFPEGGTSFKDESRLIRDRFSAVLEKWKKRMERILNIVYNDLFADGDMENMFEIFYGKEVESLIKQEQKRVDQENEKPDSLLLKEEEEETRFIDPVKVVESRLRFNDSDVYKNGLVGKRKLEPSSEADPIEKNRTMAILLLSRSLGINSSMQDKDVVTPEFSLLAEKILENVHRHINTEPTIQVAYVNIPNISEDELLMKYAMGVINWELYKQISCGISNLPTHEGANGKKRKGDDHSGNDSGNHSKSKKGKWNGDDDPWAQEVKLSIVNAQKSQSLAKLGLVGQIMFPPVALSSPEDKNEKSTTTTKSSSSSSEKKE